MHSLAMHYSCYGGGFSVHSYCPLLERRQRKGIAWCSDSIVSNCKNKKTFASSLGASGAKEDDAITYVLMSREHTFVLCFSRHWNICHLLLSCTPPLASNF